MRLIERFTTICLMKAEIVVGRFTLLNITSTSKKLILFKILLFFSSLSTMFHWFDHSKESFCVLAIMTINIVFCFPLALYQLLSVYLSIHSFVGVICVIRFIVVRHISSKYIMVRYHLGSWVGHSIGNLYVAWSFTNNFYLGGSLLYNSVHELTMLPISNKFHGPVCSFYNFVTVFNIAFRRLYIWGIMLSLKMIWFYI